MLAWIARPCVKLSKTRLSTRHSCISEPQEDSLDGEQLRSLRHFHPLALSLSQSLCFDHSEAVGFRLLSVRRLTVSLKLSHKLLVQFGVCYTYSTKTALSYLHLTTVTSFNNSTDVHGQACSSESRGCEKKMATFSTWSIAAAHFTAVFLFSGTNGSYFNTEEEEETELNCRGTEMNNLYSYIHKYVGMNILFTN